METIELFLEDIKPNPDQPRKHFRLEELRGLAQSIRTNGVILPVAVYKDDEQYFLIDGERRWRAAKMAGLKKIHAVVRHVNGDRGLLALVANVQRADLSPIEEAQAFRKMKEMGLSNIDITHRVGVSQPKVAGRLKLLELDEEIQPLINKGLLPVDQRSTDALLSIKDKEHRVKLAQKIARPKLQIGTVVSSCQKFNAALAAEPAGEKVPALHFAARKAGERNEPRWDMLRQLGKVPPWNKVVEAARETCGMCPLRETASTVVCADCPGVLMVRELIKRTAK